MHTCKPEDWFLSWDDTFDFVVHEQNQSLITKKTDPKTKIDHRELLRQRRANWDVRNHLNWHMKDADKHLLAPYTKNNEVTALVDGKNFMENLYENLYDKSDEPRGSNNDFMLVAGWDFSPNRFLKDADPKKSLLEVLEDVIGKNVDVRLLAFKNPLRFTPALSAPGWIVDAVNALKKQTAFLDGKTGGGLLSHHQKSVFIGSTQNKGCSIAYVGGMDLAADRWDTNEHKKKSDEKEDQFFAWHDIQLKVTGDATTQIWASFAERWDNHIARGKNWQTAPFPRRRRPSRADIMFRCCGQSRHSRAETRSPACPRANARCCAHLRKPL